MPSAGKDNIDLRDPTAVAVEVTAVKGQMALLAQQVSSGLSNVSSQLSALQGEVRDQGKTLKCVESGQHDMQSHSKGLDRLALAIERNSAEFGGWRDRHEADNKGVSDRVTTFRGVLIGVVAVIAVAAGAIAMNQEIRFKRADERLDVHIATVAEGKAIIERRMDRADTEIEKLKSTREAR